MKTFYIFTTQGWCYIYKKEPKLRKDGYLRANSQRQWIECLCTTDFADVTGVVPVEKKLMKVQLRVVK